MFNAAPISLPPSIYHPHPLSKDMAQPAPPPSPPTQASTSTAGTTHHKKHTRHHVKRRSTGRVHVTKLAPMARANSHNAHTDTEAEPDTDQQFKRPHVRRSQSQRSLHRLSSFERKGAGLTALAALEPSENAVAISPPTTPPPKRQQQQEERPTPSVSSPAVLRKDELKPNFFVSHMAPAAPIEQTFNAVANNLVVPDNAALPAAIQQASPSKPSSAQPVKKKHSPLRSQFVEDHHPRRPLSNVASAATAQPPGMTRTQQKVLLQRQQCLVDDENNLAHPRNMLRLTRELERVGNEYRCVRRFRDPMLESLARCMELRDSSNHPTQQNDPHRLDTTQRTRSSSVLPSSTQADTLHNTVQQQPHTEHREAIRRRHMQLKMASTQPQSSLGSSSSPSSVQSTTSTLGMLRWSAGAFLDRMWNGYNH